MGNGNSTRSKSKVHGSTEPQYSVPRQGKPYTSKAHVANFPTQYAYGASSFGGEFASKPKLESSSGPYSEQHGARSTLDNDDTFTDYIRRQKQRIRTVSNVGQENGNVAAPTFAPDVATNCGVSNNKENQSDEFSEFIKLAKKKLRTKSRVGRDGSFQRG